MPEAAGVTDAGVPDAVAVFEGGELIGWDESAEHAFYFERGKHCGQECVNRSHRYQS